MSGGKRKRGLFGRRKGVGSGPAVVPTWTEFVGRVAGSARASQSVNVTTLDILSYEITAEPMFDDPSPLGLTKDQADRIQDVAQRVNAGEAARLVNTLEALVDECPQVPKLWNYLAVAYNATERSEDANRIIEETYRRFPTYLFAITNYGMVRITQGHPEDVPKILGGNFLLHRVQEGRTRFHISEAVSFFGLLGHYFLAIHQPKQAAVYLDILEKIAPDHPMTQQVRSQMLLAMAEMTYGHRFETT